MHKKIGSNANRPSPAAKAYFTEQELSDYLSVSVKWLRKMRLEGGGIPYCKFGSSVRYAIQRVHEYEAECVRTSTSDIG